MSFIKIHAFRRKVRKLLPKCLFDHIWSRSDLDLLTSESNQFVFSEIPTSALYHITVINFYNMIMDT